jgi:BCD family chlorophyll transporter-like MFS transporter
MSATSRDTTSRVSAGSRAFRFWNKLGLGYLPIADVVSDELPLKRLLRLALFQVSVGMAVALVVGTLNRVMIVELGVSARLVAIMVALPLVFAPARALIGFRSDNHRSLLGWRRTPYLWFGTMLQFGGLAMMPFALLVLSGAGGGHCAPWVGSFAVSVAFLLTGAGLHTTQTVGLALATDIAPERSRPQVVAVLCAMLLVGVLISAVLFGILLSHFTVQKLIQVIQGAALMTMILNGAALWKQEPRRALLGVVETTASFRQSMAELVGEPQARRRLAAVALGTIAFSLQDVLLEPYGGQVLGLPVAATTALTALLAVGGLCGFAAGGWLLARKTDQHRVAALGVLVGLFAFSCVIFAAPMRAPGLFAMGTTLIGCGAALFLVGTLSSAVDSSGKIRVGLKLGSWGAVQAFAAGTAIAAGGLLHDTVAHLALGGALGPSLVDSATGYEAVYGLEMVILFATLVVLGPLVRFSYPSAPLTHFERPSRKENLA